MLLLIISGSLIFSLGYLAQTSGLCLVRGVNEFLSGKPLFLLAILFSGSFVWLTMLFATSMGLSLSFISNQLSIFSAVGGFLFGIGACINNGCGVSTISKLARGHTQMLATVFGWFIGWVLLVKFVPKAKHVLFTVDYGFHIFILMAFSFLAVLLLCFMSSENRKIWFMILTIGLMASVVFMIEPLWTPSSFLKDSSLAFWSKSVSNYPSWQRMVLIVSLLLGMAIAALKTKTFRLIILSRQECFFHLFAGILMGIGAATANGGNDSQLLLGLPSLSPAGFSTVISMLLGIILTFKLKAVIKMS